MTEHVNLQIVSDGTGPGTTITAGGKPVDWVTRIDLTITPDDLAKLTLEVEPDIIDLSIPHPLLDCVTVCTGEGHEDSSRVSIELAGTVVGPDEILVLATKQPMTGADAARLQQRIPEALHGRVVVVVGPCDMAVVSRDKPTKPPQAMSDLLTIDQAAARLQVHPKTLRRWVVEGRLPASRVGRGIRLKAADVDALLDER